MPRKPVFEWSSGESSDDDYSSEHASICEDIPINQLNANFLDKFGRICFWDADGVKRFRRCRSLKNENLDPNFERFFYCHKDIQDFFIFAIDARIADEKGRSADLAHEETLAVLRHDHFLDDTVAEIDYNLLDKKPRINSLVTRVADKFEWNVQFGFMDPALAGGFVVNPEHRTQTPLPVIYGLTDRVISDPQLKKIVAVQFQTKGNERLGFLQLLHCAVGRKALAGILVCENRAAVIWFEDVGQATKIHKYPHSGLAECTLKEIAEILAHLVYLACDFSDPFDWTLWRQYERVEADPDKPNMRQMPILCADGSVKNFVRHCARIDDI